MYKLITEDDVKRIIKNGITEILVDKGVIVTPSAYDLIRQGKIKIVHKTPEANQIGSASVHIAIGSDHTGFKMKKILYDYLNKKGYTLTDVGTFSEEAVDYPDIALDVAKRVITGEAKFGIILDATGIPSAITANKLPGIRAATCYNEFSAKSSREHNDANILVVGAKALGEESIKSLTDVWLNSNFLGERHQKRLDKIKLIEEKYGNLNC
jgi:ribose 5-phosphate isomerase B